MQCNICLVGVRLRRDEGGAGFYAHMFLCLVRRRNCILEICTRLLPAHSQGMKARQDIPERPSSGTARALLLAEMKEVCGTDADGAGLYENDARKGFPDDMLKVKNNALFYVHGRSSKAAVWSQLLCLRAGADGPRGLATTAADMLG